MSDFVQKVANEYGLPVHHVRKMAQNLGITDHVTLVRVMESMSRIADHLEETGESIYDYVSFDSIH